MRIAIILLLFFGASCSTSKKGAVKDTNDISWIKDEDFQKKAEVPYTTLEDYFQASDEGFSSPLKHESQQIFTRSDYKEAKIDSSLFLATKECYEGDTPKGLEKIVDYYAEYKNNPIYYNSLGICFTLEGQFRKALVFFNLALKAKKNYAPAINNIGILYSIQGKNMKALSAFKKANEVSPKSKSPMVNLSKVYLKHYLIASSRKYISDSKIQDDYSKFLEGVDNIVREDFKAAIASLELIEKKNIFEPALSLNLASAYLGDGRLNDARNVIGDVNLDKSSPFFRDYRELIDSLAGE
ncbi:MAG: tetratricopeptide repeat protein [Bacteriovoracaceae bacterium]